LNLARPKSDIFAVQFSSNCAPLPSATNGWHFVSVPVAMMIYREQEAYQYVRGLDVSVDDDRVEGVQVVESLRDLYGEAAERQ
jgi:hypothetical protein